MIFDQTTERKLAIEKKRSDASRARRLARTTVDDVVLRQRLEAYADELDAEAERLEMIERAEINSDSQN